MDIWDVLSKECREEVILVDCEDLIYTLNNYLRKHRWVNTQSSDFLFHNLVLHLVLDNSLIDLSYIFTKCQQKERRLKVDYHNNLRAPASPKKSGAIFVANWGPLGAKLKRK